MSTPLTHTGPVSHASLLLHCGLIHCTFLTNSPGRSQACTEMSMPMATDGKRDMFWVSDWDAAAQAAQCMEQFGVSPREGWGAAEYGGYDSWSQGE